MTALDGLRVLEIAGLSGAYAGKLLADMGADVIRVEPPDAAAARGADSRDESLRSWHYNAGKQSLVLDLDDERGRARFLALAGAADVLLETAAPGTLERLGLGAAELARLAPRLVHVSITPFGQSGPYSDWRASDLVAQAMGGMVFVNGHADAAPLAGFGLQAYHSASAYAAIAALLALLAREKSGRGQHADVSLQACVAATVEHVSGFYQQTGTIEERRGSLHWSRYFRVGRCRDGYVMHCTLGDWTSLIEWVKGDGKAQDLDQPQWEEFAFRKANCEHVFDVLDAWAAGYDVAELVEGAQLRRVPYAPILPLTSLAADPQLRERGFFVDVPAPIAADRSLTVAAPISVVEPTEAQVREVTDSTGATIRCPGAPYRFSATPWRLRSAGGIADWRREARSVGEVAPGPVGAADGAQPLAGIRVVDFTWVVAGPVATRILADQGAEVIKIERRDSLDFGSRRGGLTGNLNRGKQSVVLNMARPEGIAVARDLITRADVVIDNFSARVMPNWGLDYESLRRLNPGIIAVSMSGFGRSGPYRDYVSYGPTLQALTGFTALMRHAGSAPAGWGFSYSDMAGGYSAALAVLMALWHRQRTGAGQFIDLSQFESLAALLGVPLLDVLNPLECGDADGAAMNRRTPEANSSFEGDAAPHGIYRCADRAAPGRTRDDRWCAIAVFGAEDWARFTAALDTPDWTREARFATVGARLEHRRDLDALVETWTRTRAAEEVMHTLQAAGIAAGIAADAEDLCRRDPQLRHRGYWVELDTPEGERVMLDGVPFAFDDLSCGPAGPGPLLGEHTAAVLRRVLGLSEDGIAALRAAGAIG